MQRTRTRARAQAPLSNKTWNMDYVPVQRYVFPVDRQTTIDEEHPWYAWRRVLKRTGHTTVVDIGGEFTSTTYSVDSRFPSVELKAQPYDGLWLYNFSGVLVPSWAQAGTPIKSDVTGLSIPRSQYAASIDSAQGTTNWGPPINSTDEELATLGASLNSKLAPTAPHNNVYTSLGELRNDGLPAIPFLSFLKKGGKLPEKVGDEWLNYQFAIAPTVSDVKSIVDTIQKSDKLWRQYLRDSGRLVRRRMDLDPHISTTTATVSGSPPNWTQSAMWSSIGPITTVTKTTRKRWFTAGYMYYVSPDSLSGMDGWLEKAQYLYGWKPSPSGVYNLTAWSWLLDWFTNTGDVIDNVSLYLQDPFLTRYAYIMEESVIENSRTQTCVDNTGTEHTMTAVFTTTIKKRRVVDPLHFGLKNKALTARQLSILAALGLTRGRNPGSM